MDTGYNDTRNGIRIEIQALRLNMYKLMYELTNEKNYLNLEIDLKEKVRKYLWNGSVLADGLNDFTIRPNIFIASYVYPSLLTNDEWSMCFENILPGLWLSWGGLATIDTGNSLFTGQYSGQDNRSYHRGDSWFWLNNLAAIVFNRVNREKFRPNTEKILEASTEEILWKGAIGNASELSSAKSLESQGCVSQAWSSSMFIELIHELFRS